MNCWSAEVDGIGMASEPSLNSPVFVGGVVVDDQMEIFSGGVT